MNSKKICPPHIKLQYRSNSKISNTFNYSLKKNKSATPSNKKLNKKQHYQIKYPKTCIVTTHPYLSYISVKKITMGQVRTFNNRLPTDRTVSVTNITDHEITRFKDGRNRQNSAEDATGSEIRFYRYRQIQ